MQLGEIVENLIEIQPKLKLTFEVLKNHSGKPYYLKNIIALRKAINTLASIPGFTTYELLLSKTRLFENDADELSFTITEYEYLERVEENLRNSIEAVKEMYIKISYAPENSIKIKLPPHHNFEDLQKIIGHLKLAIETPIKLSKEDKTIEILRAEPGSIWLIVLLSTAGITLLGKIVHLALDVRERWIKQNQMLTYSKAANLKVDLLDGISKAFELDLSNYLDTEIDMISNEHFTNKEQAFKAIKTSVSLFGELYEKDMEIIYPADANNGEKLFPTSNEIKQLTEGMKQINAATDKEESIV